MPASLNISTWTIVRLFLVAIVIALLYAVRDVVAALIFAVIIASALEPGINWFKDRRVPRLVSVILLYMIVAATTLFLGYLLVPLLIDDISALAGTFPVVREEFLSFTERSGLDLLTPLISEKIPAFIQEPTEYISQLGTGIFAVVSNLFGGLFTFALIIVFSFYLAVQERGIENFLRLIAPLKQEAYVVDLWMRAQRQLGRWLRAQLLLGAIVGVLLFIGLTFMGLKNALFFALLGAVFEIIPVAGPILASLPPIVTAFLDSSLLGVAVVALYVIVQQIESNVIVPVVMKRSVGLNPLVVVLALLVGAKIGGLFGILLAVPIAAVLAELVKDWDKKKRELVSGGLVNLN